MKFLIALLASILLFGCQTNKTKLDLGIPANAKIGIVSNLQGKPIHYHIGTTVFNNNKKIIDGDWEFNQFEEYIYDQISGLKNYTVEIVKPTSGLIAADKSLVNSNWANSLEKEYEPDLIALRDQHDLDYLIAITTGIDRSNNDIPHSGFGLKTNCFLSICYADAIAYPTVSFFELSDSPKYLTENSGNLSDQSARVEIDLKKGVENLTAEDYEKARLAAIEVMRKKMESMLQRSGLRD